MGDDPMMSVSTRIIGPHYCDESVSVRRFSFVTWAGASRHMTIPALAYATGDYLGSFAKTQGKFERGVTGAPALPNRPSVAL